MGSKGKVLMAMSGGVDSSTAAVKLLEQGYELIGVTMHLFCPDPDIEVKGGTCCSLDDVADARSVAHALGFEHYVLNFSDAFEENVIERFCSAYERGRTPNPCIDCNRYLKFQMLQKRRRELGCDYVATGHYARRVQLPDGTFALKRGADAAKDQSYVLYHLNQDTLAHMLFPLGDMTKAETRALAAKSGLVNANKDESQDICFVPDGDYARFIEDYTGRSFEPGEVVDVAGNHMGEHLGLIRYTIGQRKGLNLGGGMEPLYVVAKDAAQNKLVVGHKEDLLSTHVEADDVNLISDRAWEGARAVQAKVGYRMKAAAAHAVFDAEHGRLKVDFAEPVRAVSPGQSLVIYDNDVVIGGGTIC